MYRRAPPIDTEQAVTVVPTLILPTELSHPTLSPPALLCEVAEIVIGADTFPFGAVCPGAVHAFTIVITNIKDANVTSALRNMGLFIRQV